MDHQRLLVGIAIAAIAAACNPTTATTAPPQPSVALHDTTPFPLTGRHITTPCAACHADTLYANTPTVCAACHPNPHVGKVYPDCAICHNTSQWF